MKIWIARHGQTRLNQEKRWQGHLDEPLNDTGIRQAREMRRKIGDITFDKVYASPLKRARVTATILAGVDEKDLVIDPRIVEVDLGKYEGRAYANVPFAMTMYWAKPTVFPAPESVETISHMIDRASSFLKDVEEDGRKNHYENILVVCHGGIMRVLSGYMLGRKDGLLWHPRPRNCEIRVFDADPGKHIMLEDYQL